MKKEIGVILLLGIMLIAVAGLTSAAIAELGTFKQGTTIQLIQTCDDCTYNNITHIQRPDGVISFLDVTMTKNDTFYNYTLSGNFTSILGEYIVNGVGDTGGTATTWNYKFTITPSGFVRTLGFYIVLLIFIVLVVLLGFSIREVWFVVLGGMGLIMLGIYSINSGIVGFRDMFMTWGVGIFQIAVGAILSIGAGMQKLEYD